MAKTRVTIEQVSLDSVEARVVLAAAAAELDRRYGPGTDAEPFSAATFEPPLGSFLIARRDGLIVGGVGVRSIGERVGEIKRLWVDDEIRRMGVATALMDAIEAEGRALGMGVIVLETGPLQPEAVSLYASQGWESVDQLPVPVSDYSQAIRFLKYYDDSMRS